jgi:hypothetical protein
MSVGVMEDYKLEIYALLTRKKKKEVYMNR